MGVYRKIEQPKSRNVIRLKLGTLYFRMKKRLQWAFGGMKFARQNTHKQPYVHFMFESPLIRHLVGVDPALEQNKIKNLYIAIAKVQGVTLRPGEVFSYWKMIGKPTRRKGYVHGVILEKGEFGSGIGGGLCHLSGLIYWTTLHTPLTVAERHRHGYDTTPDKFFGSDATCFYNYKDLSIRNDTPHTFQLSLEITDNHLIGTWLASSPPTHTYEVYEKEGLIHLEDWGRHTRHNHVHRKIFDMAGTQTSDEFVAENHAIVK